jgi:hypothetical protein
MTVPPPPSSGPSAPDPYGSGQHGSAQHGSGPYGAASSPTGHPSPAGGPAPGGPAPGTELGADLGAALRFAGQGLLRNAAALLGAGALYLVLITVVTGLAVVAMVAIMVAMLEGAPPSNELPAGVTLVIIALSFVIALLASVIGALWQSGAAQAGGVIAEGGRPSFRQALIGVGRVVVTAVLVLVIVMIGSVLLYLPGLVAAVLLFYAIPAAVRGASPSAALRESVATARANLGTTIVGFLITMVASYVGSMILIGVIAAIPFMMLFQIALYERINGRALPEPARG